MESPVVKSSRARQQDVVGKKTFLTSATLFLLRSLLFGNSSGTQKHKAVMGGSGLKSLILIFLFIGHTGSKLSPKSWRPRQLTAFLMQWNSIAFGPTLWITGWMVWLTSCCSCAGILARASTFGRKRVPSFATESIGWGKVNAPPLSYNSHRV